MTAILATTYSDRVEIISDGAYYTDDGVLTNIKTKVKAHDMLPLAITGRGNSAPIDAMTAVIWFFARAYGSVDHALVKLVDFLARQKDREIEPFEVVVAAVSERDGPAIYYFSNTDTYGYFEPWKLYGPLPEFGGGSKISEDELAGFAVTANEDGTLLNIAVPLFEAMRRKTGANPIKPDLPEIYGIGGHLDFTMVSARGVDTYRIHEWPDKIGEKIDPRRAILSAA